MIALALMVKNGDRGAKAHALVIVGLLDYDGILNNVLEREDSPFDESLLVAGVLILRSILRADQLLGIVNALCDFGAAHGAQLVKLPFKLAQTLFGEWDRFACHGTHQFPWSW